MTEVVARATFDALGTTAVIVTAHQHGLDRAVDAVRDEIDLIDRTCSRFRPDSELERINAAGGRAIAVSTAFLDALDVALDAARWTDGAVDPTIGSALRLLGYDRTFDEVHPGAPVARFERVEGWQVVDVDRARHTVRVPAGVRLDLGATAKALAADRAAAAAADRADCGVLVALGGDIACSGEAPEDGWLVKVAEWQGADPDGPGQTVVIRDGGLATSSTTVRRWRRGDADVHHLIDPVTGRPASEHWRTVTVAAGSCVQANIATTAMIVRGASAMDWLLSLGVPARLIRADGTVDLVGGWPQDVPLDLPLDLNE